VKIEVVTLFPEMIRQAMEFGITGRAVKRGLLSVGTEDPRVHTSDVHRTVDDRPYGGGPGMVMKPEPFFAALAAIRERRGTPDAVVMLTDEGDRVVGDLGRHRVARRRGCDAIAAGCNCARTAWRWSGW